MPERLTCPTCGHPAWQDATEAERKAEPPHFCSPLRCSAWRLVGKATAPHPVTGSRSILRVVDGPEDDRLSPAPPTEPSRPRTGPGDTMPESSELERLRALEAACRKLRQANVAGMLRASDHRSAALCEQAWHEVAKHIDRHPEEPRRDA